MNFEFYWNSWLIGTAMFGAFGLLAPWLYRKWTGKPLIPEKYVGRVLLTTLVGYVVISLWGLLGGAINTAQTTQKLDRATFDRHQEKVVQRPAMPDVLTTTEDETAKHKRRMEEQRDMTQKRVKQIQETQ